MARWSDVMKLNQYEAYRWYLDGYPGCYEIGYMRDGVFNPKYIGRGANIWTRITSYMDPFRCHNEYIALKLEAQRHTLWFRVLRTPRYHGLEARHQFKYGVRDEGLYEWNQRIERAYLGH